MPARSAPRRRGFTYVACRVAPEGGGVHERDRVLLSRIICSADVPASSGCGVRTGTKGVPRTRDTPLSVLRQCERLPPSAATVAVIHESACSVSAR